MDVVGAAALDAGLVGYVEARLADHTRQVASPLDAYPGERFTLATS
jgi:hypothetical protein